MEIKEVGQVKGQKNRHPVKYADGKEGEIAVRLTISY